MLKKDDSNFKNSWKKEEMNSIQKGNVDNKKPVNTPTKETRDYIRIRVYQIQDALNEIIEYLDHFD